MRCVRTGGDVRSGCNFHEPGGQPPRRRLTSSRGAREWTAPRCRERRALPLPCRWWQPRDPWLRAPQWRRHGPSRRPPATNEPEGQRRPRVGAQCAAHREPRLEPEQSSTVHSEAHGPRHCQLVQTGGEATLGRIVQRGSPELGRVQGGIDDRDARHFQAGCRHSGDGGVQSVEAGGGFDREDSRILDPGPARPAR